MLSVKEREELSEYLAEKLKGYKRISKTSINRHILNFYREQERAKIEFREKFNEEVEIVSSEYSLDEIVEIATSIRDNGKEEVNKYFNFYSLDAVVNKAHAHEQVYGDWGLSQGQINFLISAIACHNVYMHDGSVNPELDKYR